MSERYCLRWERLDWGVDRTDYRCAECGVRVFDTEDQDARRICTECLVKDAAPWEPVEVHDHVTHCADCFIKFMTPGYGKLPPSNWWGT